MQKGRILLFWWNLFFRRISLNLCIQTLCRPFCGKPFNYHNSFIQSKHKIHNYLNFFFFKEHFVEYFREVHFINYNTIWHCITKQKRNILNYSYLHNKLATQLTIQQRGGWNRLTSTKNRYDLLTAFPSKLLKTLDLLSFSLRSFIIPFIITH